MMRRNCWTAALCLALMLFGGHRLRADEPERLQWAELKAKVEAEGWTEISTGVFERHRGGNKVEHLAYGREGLVWHIGELTRQLESMMQDYETYPSEKLAKIIDNLSVTIAKAKRELRNMPEGLSGVTAAVTGPSCDICYGATADAYPLITAQGVGAIADARFSSTCGYTGETYAYAYARATKNGTTTTLEQEDPHTGTSVTSYAAASVEGKSVSGIPCYSTANAYVQSTALQISYSTSDTNTSCPIPCTVTISGPTSVPFTTATCSTQTWTASTVNGTSPYTYKWYVNNTQVGTGSTYSRSVCHNHADFTLKVVATDANGGTCQDSRSVDVTTPNPPTVTINGSSYENFASFGPCRNVTWTSTVSGGTTPYTYQWKVGTTVVSTASSYTRSVCRSQQPGFRLDLAVTDGASNTGNDTHFVTVEVEPFDDCNPTCQ